MDTTPPLYQLRQTFWGAFRWVCEAYVYFSKYDADHWALKSFVAGIFALDTASSALLSKALYFYMVSSLPYLGGLTKIHPNLTTHVLLSTITVFGAHLFGSVRIWQLSRKVWATGISIFISTAAFGTCISPKSRQTDPIDFEHWVLLALCFACACTGLASLSMFVGLNQYSRKSAHPVLSPEWFDSVSASLFARGLLSVLIQLGCLVTFLPLPHQIYWTPLYFVGAKVIINAPLYMLNLRDRVHGKGVNEEDTVLRSATSAGFTSTTGTATLSDMFKPAPHSSSKGVAISRTVEFNREADADLAKPGFGSIGSDHGHHDATRVFEDRQKGAEAF
ncbi:hypothetical protein MVEN_00667500 [Mycena venus]|uniref:Uncharacterized protein n=1 Tax=Mycena venus TaxID=2733690 RepID=A0A8H6YL70_9AGAR|nr:hypothetical protein MVEN_00667500 [Mycena venus]